MKYKLTEIGFNSSIETAESLIATAQTHCEQYEDRKHYLPIDTVEKAIKYWTECSFAVEEIETSYCIDDYGTLKIFINDCLHSEIQDCQNMNNEEIEELINEIIGA